MKCILSFADEKIKADWDRLNSSERGEDKILVLMLNKAFDCLEADCYSGVYIQKNKIPKYYTKKYGTLPNLWKYNLTDSWWLVYFVAGAGSEPLSVVLEWMNHKECGGRFGHV